MENLWWVAGLGTLFSLLHSTMRFCLNNSYTQKSLKFSVSLRERKMLFILNQVPFAIEFPNDCKNEFGCLKGFFIIIIYKSH